MPDTEPQWYYREEYGPTATLYRFLCTFSRYLAEMRLDGILITEDVLQTTFLEIFPRNHDNDRALINIHSEELDSGCYFPDSFTQTDQQKITALLYKRKRYEI